MYVGGWKQFNFSACKSNLFRQFHTRRFVAKKKKIIVTFSFCLKYLSKLRVFNIIQEIIVHILCNFIGVLFSSFTVRDLCLIILRVLDEDYKLHTSSFDMYLNQQDEQNSCD